MRVAEKFLKCATEDQFFFFRCLHSVAGENHIKMKNITSANSGITLNLQFTCMIAEVSPEVKVVNFSKHGMYLFPC